MGLIGYLRLLRTVVIAIALAVLGMALWQFASTDASFPGLCLPLTPPLDRLCAWVRSGAHHPISDVLDLHELNRLVSTVVCMILLAGMLAWSIRAQRPLRLRLRVRTLMLVIAVLPVMWLGGQRFSAMWDRFDDYCRCRETGWHSEYDSVVGSILGRGEPAALLEHTRLTDAEVEELEKGLPGAVIE